MGPLGLVQPGTAGPESPPQPSATDLQVQFEETLASCRRLWLRGRLSGPALAAAGSAGEQPWWERWRRKPAAGEPPAVHLETRVSGHVLTAEVPLRSGGRFEAILTAELPVARRGWRIARNRVTWAGRNAEQCSVVLTPPDEARGVVIVLLPLALTSAAHGAEQFLRSEAATRLGPVLRELRQGPRGAHGLCYLAYVPPGAEPRPAALALAVTSLGWPGGNWVLLRDDHGSARCAFAEGIDRLRWLFAGNLDLVVINLEPDVAAELPALLEPREDRARVSRLVNPAEDPAAVLGGLPAEVVGRPGLTLRPTRAYLVPRHPVVFCHGMLAFSRLHMRLPEDLNSFSPLREFLRQRGFRALFPQVAPTGGVVARAGQLREQIRRWTDEPVNLIAHSMGGLDARYLLTHLGLADRVRSLTTIATPHRGTYLADWFLANYRQRVPLLLALEALGVNVDGFQDCRLDACRQFNARTPDVPGVRYFSFGGAVAAAHVAPVLRRAWHLLTVTEGPNDGMVSTASARWGEYLGTLHVDHFAQTPDMAFVRPGETFDALGFYLRLLQDLARQGL